MKAPHPTTVDFETFGIEGRPFYPPVPVGVSIGAWGKKKQYYSWGHPSGNNCTWTEAKLALEQAWRDSEGLVFQNGKFDIDVAETHFGLAQPSWDRIHDTMFLLFLDSPHEKQLGLKPSAERILQMPSEERDAVAEWLVAHQPIPGIKIGASSKSKHPAGKYIAYAPGTVVGPYANGDSIRTEKIFAKLWKSVCIDRKMLEGYNRERRLMPILLESERHGLRVDIELLRHDVKMYLDWQVKIDAWLIKKLGDPVHPKTGEPINLDSGDQLADALIAKGLGDPTLMGITKGGKIATNKAAITAGVTDKQLGAVLKYRAQLSTCMKTFMMPWLATAEKSGGLIFTNWNQVKGSVGTRTGRLSSTPNFQNIPKEFEAIFFDRANDVTKGLPKCPWTDLPSLPLCRGYVIPYDDNHLLAGRDYSQQEPRILAHFEGGSLQEQYIANPWIDYHDNAREHLERVMGRPYKRKPVKNINLGIIYGQGVGSLAEKNESTVEETKEIRDAIYNLYPGLKEMYKDMRVRSKSNLPIRTWGSREYYCEEPAIINGRIMTFDYKMVNVLVQGSAADCTKEAVIRFHEMMKQRWKILLQVHDEIVISVPKEDFMEAMQMLREAMESVEFDVKILSEGAWSSKNWAKMQDYDKKGQLVDAIR